LLFDNADVACESTLSHNRGQALCLSLDELRARRDSEIFLRTAESLCRFAQIDPRELELPDEGTVVERATHGRGHTRPELAVLVGLAKMQAQALLHGSELLDSPYLDPLYRGYFPEQFQDERADALSDHRLRAEITGLRVVNRLVDAGGATLFDALCTELGVGVPEVAAAMIQAEDLLRAPEVRGQLLESVNASREGVYRALIELDQGVRVVARFLVKSGATDLDGERILRWRSGLDVLASSLQGYLSEGETTLYEARRSRLVEEGLGEPLAESSTALPLAESIAALPLADRGLNIIQICEGMEVNPLEAARTYARLGDESGINWIYGRLPQADIKSVWDRVALVDIRWELLDLQRHITERVLAYGEGDLQAAIDRFLTDYASEIERVNELQRSAATSTSATTLAVISARLRCLRRQE
jgi:glutamate dehydrogenase